MRPFDRTTRPVAAALTILALVACQDRVLPGDVIPNLSVRPLADPIPRPAGVLQATDGADYDLLDRTSGRLTLLFFGFTHCPDICPLEMAKVAGALSSFEPGTRPDLDVLFVSVDPDRDSLERLDSWLAGFDTTFTGLRGSHDDVGEILAQIGFDAMPTHDADHGGIAHPASLYVFTPDDTAWLAYPASTLDPATLHRDLAALARIDWSAP